MERVFFFVGFIGYVYLSHTESFCSLVDQYVVYAGLGPRQHNRYSDWVIGIDDIDFVFESRQSKVSV